MGLQRKTGTGIQTQAQQPYKREDHVVWGEKGERTMRLWQSGDPMEETQLIVPGA